jgi:hypothetical protein
MLRIFVRAGIPTHPMPVAQALVVIHILIDDVLAVPIV